MSKNALNFILASGNEHKAEEFSELFLDSSIEISAAGRKIEVEETGGTYFENAFIKAKAYYDEFKLPVLADDSGLNVEALPGELGVYSARFGGEGLSDRQRAELLLEKMGDEPNRKASFSCVLCFYLGPDEVFYFEGSLRGMVGKSYFGEHGFGYDPVFHLLGEHTEKTLAQLPEWKLKNSHRAQACGLARGFFST